MAEHHSRTSRSPMMTGMFRDRESAERAYASLTARGYTTEDVTLLMSDEARRRHFGHGPDTELGSKAAEGAGIGAAVGGGAGALLAGLAAAGVIALPGIGLIAMGPIAAALTGGAIGAASGGLLGALIGAGIPEEQAKRSSWASRREPRRMPPTSKTNGGAAGGRISTAPRVAPPRDGGQVGERSSLAELPLSSRPRLARALTEPGDQR